MGGFQGLINVHCWYRCKVPFQQGIYRNITNRSPGASKVKSLGRGYIRFREPGVALTNVISIKKPALKVTLKVRGASIRGCL